MDKLIEIFRKKINTVDMTFIRSLEAEINWGARLVCIRGPRGTGKTTLLLQHIKKTFENNLSKVLYISLDNIYFSDNSLMDLAEDFVRHGGTHLFLDEVHKYPLWSQTIKNLYDDYPELSIVFTGSSLLEILNARADLSRRALVYDMQGLSFREYLGVKTGINFPLYSLEDILQNNAAISAELVSKIKPFEFFENYLKTGYYPFFLEGEDDYYSRVNEIINMILDIELPALRKLDVSYIPKIKKLLAVIGRSAPFIPNVSELASQIGIARQTLILYFQYLEDSMLINQLFRQTRGLGSLEKPDKLFLENTNFMYSLNGSQTDIGNMRETFVYNQLKKNHEVLFSKESDFFVDGKYTFEVGGKNKKRDQIKDVPDSYIIADNIEYGTGSRIPIWLFGFLY
jgi:predicted AAA+ superfamily ATPase